MTFGEKLSNLRREKNYTQEQLAEILGVSRQSISKWESDIAYPETDKLIALGKLLECSMDYLLKEEVTEKGTIENYKYKVQKILKIAGVIFGVVLAIDIISLIVYFAIYGIPHQQAWSNFIQNKE